jgi:raffinose/stachyose/melibiose transport system permease protein
MWIIAICFLYPFFFIVNNSFKSSAEIATDTVSLAKSVSFVNYIRVMEDSKLLLAFSNSILVTVVTIAIAIILGSMISFALSQSQSRITRMIFVLFVSGLMIPGMLKFLPLYKLAYQLHIINTYIGYCLITAVGNLPLLVFLYTGFLRSISAEIIEAAKIDGASIYRIFYQIVFPLLKPINATAIVILAIGVWNDFLGPLLYLQHSSQQTLVLFVSNFQGEYSYDWSSIFPLIVLSILPVLIAYLFLQSHIIKGISGGALKG